MELMFFSLQVLQTCFGFLGQVLSALLNTVSTLWGVLVFGALPVLVQVFSTAWFAVVKFISTVCYALLYGAQQGIPAIVYAFSLMWTSLVQLFLTLWYVLESGAKQGVPAVAQVFSSLWSAVVMSVNNVSEPFMWLAIY